MFLQAVIGIILMVLSPTIFALPELLTCQEPKIFQLTSRPVTTKVCGMIGPTSVKIGNQTLPPMNRNCAEYITNTTYSPVVLTNGRTTIRISTSPSMPLIMVQTTKAVNITIDFETGFLKREIYTATCKTNIPSIGVTNCSVPAACYGETYKCFCGDLEVIGECGQKGKTTLDKLSGCNIPAEETGEVRNSVRITKLMTVGEELCFSNLSLIVGPSFPSEGIHKNKSCLYFSEGNYVVNELHKSVLYDYYITARKCPSLDGLDPGYYEQVVKYENLTFICGDKTTWYYFSPENVYDKPIATTTVALDTMISSFSSEKLEYNVTTVADTNTTSVVGDILSDNVSVIAGSAAGGVTFFTILGASVRAWKRRKHG